MFEGVDFFSFFSQLMIFGVNFDLEFSDGHLELVDHALKVFGSLLEFLVLFVILSDGRDVGEGVVGRDAVSFEIGSFLDFDKFHSFKLIVELLVLLCEFAFIFLIFKDVIFSFEEFGFEEFPGFLNGGTFVALVVEGGIERVDELRLLLEGVGDFVE